MAQLPLGQADQVQTKWKAALDPILANRILQGNAITTTLNPGVNTINHLLGRMQIGWLQSDVSGPAVIWRSQPFNTNQLTLTSSAVAAVTLSLWCY